MVASSLARFSNFRFYKFQPHLLITLNMYFSALVNLMSELILRRVARLDLLDSLIGVS